MTERNQEWTGTDKKVLSDEELVSVTGGTLQGIREGYNSWQQETCPECGTKKTNPDYCAFCGQTF